MNRAFVAVFLVFILCSILTVSQLAWGNCRYFEMPQLVSPRNEIWETSAEENPVLITCHFPDLSSETHHQYWISALVPQPSFRGKPEVSSRNVGCFLQLDFMTTLNEKPLPISLSSHFLTPFHEYDVYCSNYSMKSYIFSLLGSGLVSFLF